MSVVENGAHGSNGEEYEIGIKNVDYPGIGSSLGTGITF